MARRSHVPRHHLMHDDIHTYHEEPRVPRGPPLLPIEEELAMRRDEIQKLISDNRILLESNILMKREINIARDELHALSQDVPKIHAEKDVKARELIRMNLKQEAELRAIEPLKLEALELRSEAKKVDSLRREMLIQIESMSQDLKRLQDENLEIPKLRMEIEGLHHDLVRVRTAFEYEQKEKAVQIEQKQLMQKNLVVLAREIENLRAKGTGPGPYSAGMGSGLDKELYYWASYDSRGGFPRR